jgi:hypothetical protein
MESGVREVPDPDKIIGSVSSTISQFGLDSYLNNLGYSHEDCSSTQVPSFVIDRNWFWGYKEYYPGKLFEYMVSNRPIIGIDFAEIITTTNTGCNYSEKVNLKV